MVRIGERPRWKRILYLEFMAIEYKREIMIEGYTLLGLGLTFPVWCWYFLPSGVKLAREWGSQQRELHRRKPYAGINIAESNTARPRWGWMKRRGSLSQTTSPPEVKMELSESPLLRLPEEIRREIFLYLVRPAHELTICSMKKEKRLVALPTQVWLDAYADAVGRRKNWETLLKFLNSSKTPDDSGDQPYTCKDMLSLAKTSRQFYQEIIPMLYGENVFHFHPLRNIGHAGSVEHFMAFTQSIPAARLDDLRHIRLRAHFNFHHIPKRQTYIMRADDEYRWKTTCNSLRQMANLLTLHVCLVRVSYQTGSTMCGRRRSVDGPAPEDRILQQLVGVRAKMSCVVEVPWKTSVLCELPGAEFELRETVEATDVPDESLPVR